MEKNEFIYYVGLFAFIPAAVFATPFKAPWIFLIGIGISVLCFIILGVKSIQQLGKGK